MARAKSVILTPAEKKTIVVDLRNRIKEADATLKAIKATAKESDAKLAAVVKVSNAAIATAQKGRVAEQKVIDKTLAAAEKAAATLKAQLAAITTPPAETKAAE